MRRIILLATTLLLPGCAGSGFYAYVGDTSTPPFGANPNKAPGFGENYQKTVAKDVQDPPPILYQPGDVWPAPPKPPPTLKDLQAQQTRELNSGSAGYSPLQPLPNLPGYEVPNQTPSPTLPGQAVPKRGISHSVGGPIGTGGGENPNALNPADNGTIIVPNGNGTSTVISPNGAVTTIKTPGK